MQILAHRGYWNEKFPKNSKEAFINAFNHNFGIETDIRDICGKLVISHNCPIGNEITFEELLQLVNNKKLTLALNIKADGLSDNIVELLRKYRIDDYFTFDMSIPEMVVQKNSKSITFFTGISDISPNKILYAESKGIWLDSFNDIWYDQDKLDEILRTTINNDAKKVCIVSEDLHKRNNQKQWAMIKQTPLFSNDNLFLCTDFPNEAKEYFYGKD